MDRREYLFEAKVSPKVDGYSGFIAEFCFLADGTFIDLGIAGERRIADPGRVSADPRRKRRMG
jgi:hypothetical protein